MVATHNEITDIAPRAGELLREVARLYSRAQRVVAQCCRITSTQCHILAELGRSGAQPMTGLGTRLMLEKSWVSRAVDGLVERGLVARQPNPADARSWIVGLTAAGRRRVRELHITLDAHAAQLLESLSERDRSQVNQSLLLLLRVLREDLSATCCLPATERREAACR